MKAARKRLAGYARRPRSTKAEHRAFCNELVGIVAEVQPCTVRQVYYQAVVRDLVEKTEREYDRVQVALVKLRETGQVPWEHVVDSTRWVRRVDSWASPAAAVEAAARVYRRSIWMDAKVVPEVWLEKDALAGVVFDVTAEWNVGLYTARGYASLPFVHTAAEDIVARYRTGKRTAIYHLGDFDPSGRDAARAIRERLTEFCIAAGLPYSDPKAAEMARLAGMELAKLEEALAGIPGLRRIRVCEGFTFEELAVTPEQIEELDLPLRPTKKTDSRARAFEDKYGAGGSVELDAIHPETLREMVTTAIEEHMPRQQLDVLRTVEAEERRGLELLARRVAEEAPAA